jgi:hypothetical protein
MPGAHAAQDSMTNEKLNWLALTPTVAPDGGAVFVLFTAFRRVTSRSASQPAGNPGGCAVAASLSYWVF